MKKIFLMSSGSPLLREAVKTYNSERLVLVEPYGNCLFLRLVRKVCVRVIPSIWFNFFELNKLKQLGFEDSIDEHLIFFDSPYWFSLLFFYKRRLSKARISVWFWNPMKDNKYLAMLNELDVNVSTFDKGDAIRNNWGYHPQFYWNNLEEKCVVSKFNHSVFYVGREKNDKTEARECLLNGILEKLDVSRCDSLAVIISKKGASFNSTKYIQVMNRKDNIAYPEVVGYLIKSRSILEINAPGQVGLTLRALEAVFYNKKLITNNIEIKEYDFYKRENIYIVGHDERNLYDFINSDTFEVSEEIKSKYTFSHWVEYMEREL